MRSRVLLEIKLITNINNFKITSFLLTDTFYFQISSITLISFKKIVHFDLEKDEIISNDGYDNGVDLKFFKFCYSILKFRAIIQRCLHFIDKYY